MESEKWPAFITGFVLGILVTLGVVGGFGWQKYQQARAEAEEAREQLRAAEEKEHKTGELVRKIFGGHSTPGGGTP